MGIYKQLENLHTANIAFCFQFQAPKNGQAFYILDVKTPMNKTFHAASLIELEAKLKLHRGELDANPVPACEISGMI